MVAFLHVLLAFCLGAFAGRFMLVVVRYLPAILFKGPSKGNEPRDIFKLFFEAPLCWSCRHSIDWSYNVPILGYLLMRGRCPYCQSPLGVNRFWLEFSVALLFAGTVLFFSLSPLVLFVLGVNCVLICCFITDYEHGILPDQFTLTLVWVGLIGSLYPMFISPQKAIMGAVGGYGIFWIMNEVYRYFRNREGMYPGDFKLNAGIGACVGLKMLFPILGISFLLMIIFSLSRFLYAHRSLNPSYLHKEIAYGCYSTVMTQAVIYLMLFGFI
jgi:leader peptidase (prepilin peptidase) / N-methyltransferase